MENLNTPKTNNPSDKWNWMMNFCKTQGVSPSRGWEKAEQEWNKLRTMIDQQQLILELSDLLHSHESEGVYRSEPGATPVTISTIATAYEFIRMLPSDVSKPLITLNGDGTIKFKWFKHKNWVISVDVAEKIMVYYAGLLNEKSFSGSGAINKAIPQELIKAIYYFDLMPDQKGVTRTHS